MIADELIPCEHCGQQHEKRTKPNKSVTWADPENGHYYTRMESSEFARRALEGDDDG